MVTGHCSPPRNHWDSETGVKKLIIACLSDVVGQIIYEEYTSPTTSRMRRFFASISLLTLLLRGDLFEIAHDSTKYTIVLDAGSTGSRIYVYMYDPIWPLETITEVSHMRVHPALSTFVGNPGGLATQLESLIKFAKQRVQPPES